MILFYLVGIIFSGFVFIQYQKVKPNQWDLCTHPCLGNRPRLLQGKAYTLQSLNPLSLSADTPLYFVKAYPMMIYGSCQCPWGKIWAELAAGPNHSNLKSWHVTTSDHLTSFLALQYTDSYMLIKRQKDREENALFCSFICPKANWET